MDKKEKTYCSFCGKPIENTSLLFTGIEGYICPECVSIANKYVQESKNIIDGFKYYISHENLHKNEIVQQYLNVILFNSALAILL